MSNIPHNLSEGLFRYFEPHMTVAVDNYPRDTVFDMNAFPVTDRFATATFVGRFRDAFVSLRRFGWSPTTVNLNKLRDIANQFVIIHEPNTTFVWFRDRNAWRADRAKRTPTMGMGHTLASQQSSTGVVPIRDMTAAEMQAFALLLSNKRIVGPVVVVGNLRQVHTLDVEFCESSLDVSFTWNEREGVTVIL